MRQIPLGAKGSYTMTVKHEDLASTLDGSLPLVLATKMIGLMMEFASTDAIRSYLEPGETSVGTSLALEHLAPTPEGWTVRAEAEVIKVDGRRIEFKASVKDEQEVVGAGTHGRAIVNLAKFNERLAAKIKNQR
jgi:fluoroacetyl-CoA thioesterase